MSGFEVVGVIMAAYPFLLGALDIYKATRGGKGAISLARQLKTEEIIFEEFVFHLIAPSVADTTAVRYMTSTPSDLALWKNDTLQSDMRHRLGQAKSDNLIAILGEIQELLSWLQKELAAQDHGVVGCSLSINVQSKDWLMVRVGSTSQIPRQDAPC